MYMLNILYFTGLAAKQTQIDCGKESFILTSQNEFYIGLFGGYKCIFVRRACKSSTSVRELC